MKRLHHCRRLSVETLVQTDVQIVPHCPRELANQQTTAQLAGTLQLEGAEKHVGLAVERILSVVERDGTDGEVGAHRRDGRELDTAIQVEVEDVDLDPLRELGVPDGHQKAVEADVQQTEENDDVADESDVFDRGRQGGPLRELRRSRREERRRRRRGRGRLRLFNRVLRRKDPNGDGVDVQDQWGRADGIQEEVFDVGPDGDLLDGNREKHLLQRELHTNILRLHAQGRESLNRHGEPFSLGQEEVDDPCEGVRQNKNEKHSQAGEDTNPIPKRQLDARYSVQEKGNNTNENEGEEPHPSRLVSEHSEAIVLVSV